MTTLDKVLYTGIHSIIAHYPMKPWVYSITLCPRYPICPNRYIGRMKEACLLFCRCRLEGECLHSESVVMAFRQKCIECIFVADCCGDDELLNVVVFEEVAYCG